MSFIVSKIVWALISPGNILVLLLLLAGFMAVAQRKNIQDLGRRLSFGVAFLVFFIAVLPIGDWALTPLENRFSPQIPSHVDGIIVLGGDENPRLSELRGQATAYDSASRYIHFADLAHQYPDAKLVFSGGSGLLASEAKMKASEVARQALKIMGVPVDKMVFEDQSRNTYENAIKTFSIIHPTSNQNWLLVTSAWHMPRSMGCFRSAGWNVYAQPTNYITNGEFSTSLHFNLVDHLEKLSIALHEYIGLVVYKLTGRSDKLWP